MIPLPFILLFWVRVYTPFLCFPSREDPLAFVEELVWWCWILSAFACKAFDFSFIFEWDPCWVHQIIFLMFQQDVFYISFHRKLVEPYSPPFVTIWIMPSLWDIKSRTHLSCFEYYLVKFCVYVVVCYLVIKSCLTLQCHGLYVAHQTLLSVGFPGKTIGVGCHFLLQGIFPTQGLNPCLLHLLHCRRSLYH